jgi:hypothetical protein
MERAMDNGQLTMENDGAACAPWVRLEVDNSEASAYA